MNLLFVRRGNLRRSLPPKTWCGSGQVAKLKVFLQSLFYFRFAGASRELEEAISVNPHDTEETAQTIKKALTMPEKERKNRLKKRVEEKDLQWWAEKFLEKWQKLHDYLQK